MYNNEFNYNIFTHIYNVFVHPWLYSRFEANQNPTSKKKNLLTGTVVLIFRTHIKMPTILSQMLTAIIFKFEGKNVFLVICKPIQQILIS